jgi:hypothetical protein
LFASWVLLSTPVLLWSTSSATSTRTLVGGGTMRSLVRICVAAWLAVHAVCALEDGLSVRAWLGGAIDHSSLMHDASLACTNSRTAWVCSALRRPSALEARLRLCVRTWASTDHVAMSIFVLHANIATKSTTTGSAFAWDVKTASADKETLPVGHSNAQTSSLVTTDPHRKYHEVGVVQNVKQTLASHLRCGMTVDPHAHPLVQVSGGQQRNARLCALRDACVRQSGRSWRTGSALRRASADASGTGGSTMRERRLWTGARGADASRG